MHAAARRRADWLRHVVEEIDAAKLRPGEDAELDREAHRLGHATMLAEQARHLLDALEDDERGRAGSDSPRGAGAGRHRAGRPRRSARGGNCSDAVYAALDELSPRGRPTTPPSSPTTRRGWLASSGDAACSTI